MLIYHIHGKTFLSIISFNYLAVCCKWDRNLKDSSSDTADEISFQRQIVSPEVEQTTVVDLPDGSAGVKEE